MLVLMAPKPPAKAEPRISADPRPLSRKGCEDARFGVSCPEGGRRDRHALVDDRGRGGARAGAPRRLAVRIRRHHPGPHARADDRPPRPALVAPDARPGP